MGTEITVLWTFAVFLASVFAALLAATTLKPKYSKRIMIPAWCVVGIVGFIAAFISYKIDLTNDATGILGLSALVIVAIVLLYEGTNSAKLFVGSTACLIGNVSTFMFCGTTDTLLGTPLGLIRESPYEVPNLLFFIGIKVVVYTAIYILYRKFLRSTILNMIECLSGDLKKFVAVPVVSVFGFYVINLFTNQHGIFPNDFWFFPLYLTICVIFVIEFRMLFNSVLQTARSMKTAAELNVATNIQKSMLPCIFPAFPERNDFDIYATMDPAKEVGGDFYDFFMVDERHLAIVVADVSGKGVPAALFMVIGKTLIKDHTQPGKDLGEVFTEVNELLCESNSEGLFITAFEGVLDLESGEFRYVNAGHEIPFICKKGGKFEPYKVRAGFVLAGMEGMNYKCGELKLEHGDKIFQYTDGVTEATDKNNELYGMDRLTAFLGEHSDTSPAELLPKIKEDIDAFVGDAPQFDDITMLCLEYKSRMEEQNERA